MTSAFDIMCIPEYKYIVKLDITGCKSLDITSVIDLFDVFKSLEIFRYRECENVTQYNLQRIVDLCPKLRFVDGLDGAKVSLNVVLGIVGKLCFLTQLWIEPYETDALYWPRLVWQYARVSFGPSVNDLMPCDITLSGFSHLIKTEL